MTETHRHTLRFNSHHLRGACLQLRQRGCIACNVTPLSAICLLNAGRKLSRCFYSPATFLPYYTCSDAEFRVDNYFQGFSDLCAFINVNWHTPIPPVITGIVDCSRHSFANQPHRAGSTCRCIYPYAAFTDQRTVRIINCLHGTRR